jgi:predicted dehydrogenase
MAATGNPVRVGIFGCGGWARRTHIPNLINIEGAEVVAVCDLHGDAAQQSAADFGIGRSYDDGYRMVEEEPLDALFSCVPAFARTGVEIAAVRRGIHLFSEKPQSTSMSVARSISEAVTESGVLSTVCFRERYRPLFQEARRRLSDKRVVHACFQSLGGYPEEKRRRPPGEGGREWGHWMAKAGGSPFDWGVHAVDYLRFMTGLDVTVSQAFYHHPPHLAKPLSASFHLVFDSGATASLSFISASDTAPADEPWFTIYYEGGDLSLYRYDRIEENGEVVYEADEFDPWLEQDSVFVDAVRTQDGAGLLNDYADGLKSLAPILAGWSSALRGGHAVDVAAFAAA